VPQSGQLKVRGAGSRRGLRSPASRTLTVRAAIEAMFGFQQITKENRLCSFLNKELPAQDRFLRGVTCLL